MSTENNTYEQIGKKLSGEMTTEEEASYHQWLAVREENQKTGQVMKKVWHLEPPYHKKDREERLFQKVMDGIHRDLKNKKERGTIRKWYPIAAMILILFAAGVLVYRQYQYPYQKNEKSQNQIITKSNPPGQKSKVYLPDGSVVMLNAESTITYSESYADSQRRTVSLIGEAWFEVSKDTLRPFIVTAGSTTTTALGTAFNISAYPESDQIEIALAEGKVEVAVAEPVDAQEQVSGSLINSGFEEAQIILVPGEAVTYQKKRQYFEKKYFNARETLAWKDGIIHFKDATMDEVISKLERWYGVSFVLQGNSTKPWRFSGEFKNEYLNRVLEGLAYAQDFDYSINENTVTMTFKQIVKSKY